MARLMLTYEHWSKLRIIVREHGIYDKPNLRKTVEGILYRMRIGCPWRDLPSFFDFKALQIDYLCIAIACQPVTL